MSDSMRYNLVTTFVCSECGNPLQLTYQPAKANIHDYDPATDDGITGAAKVQQRIGIHPCKKCYGAAKAPIDALRAALGKV